MITKNTPEYKKAQEIANTLVRMAGYNKHGNGTSMMDIATEALCKFCASIMQLDCFAAQIAATVDKSISVYGYQVARISDKQAWCLACAAVENNIEL